MLLFSRKHPFLDISVQRKEDLVRIVIGHTDSPHAKVLESEPYLEDIMETIEEYLK